MKYIDYKNMKDFYTIAEVCRLFEMEMMELQRYSEKYKIYTQETSTVTGDSASRWCASCTITSAKSSATSRITSRTIPGGRQIRKEARPVGLSRS